MKLLVFSVLMAAKAVQCALLNLSGSYPQFNGLKVSVAALDLSRFFLIQHQPVNYYSVPKCWDCVLKHALKFLDIATPNTVITIFPPGSRVSYVTQVEISSVVDKKVLC